MTERLNYARQLQRIEPVKAEERMKADAANPRQNSDEGRTDETVAKQAGIGSRDTLRKAQKIEDNKDLIDPDDFANWDEGKLSTKKQMKKKRCDIIKLIPYL